MHVHDLLSFRSERLQAAAFGRASLFLALAAASPAVSAPGHKDLADVQSWGYQLQQIDPDLVAASSYDLMVIDYSRDGSADLAFSRQDIAAMQEKPDGTSRIILAYLSIGEAESYRAYWQRAWENTPPTWLGGENPDWPGNYAARYWDPRWQRLIMGGPGAYLDAIIEAGFDGVYLDRVDAFDITAPDVPRDRRMELMAEFVAAIANYARQRHPGFFVVAQNAEEMLDDAAYANVIDAVAKEDLFFGLDGDGTLNAKGDLRASLGPLQRFQATGKPVFLVEYVATADSRRRARENAAAFGAPLFLGDRELDDVRSR